METGLVKGISNDDYHKGPGVSRSFLWTLLDKSPADARVEKEETDAMAMGTALHTAILEPNRFEREYKVIPADCRVGSGKGQRERLSTFEATAEINGWTTIKAEDMESIKRMANAVRSNEDAKVLLEGIEAEVSGYWFDPDEKDVLCKIRPDGIQTATGILVDLKKAADARERIFVNKAHGMGYHVQAFMCLYGMTHITGVEHQEFRFIVAEDHEPWNVVVYRASQEFLHVGGIDFGRAFRLYVECLRSGKWLGYPGGVHDLNPPGWRMRKEMMSEIIE